MVTVHGVKNAFLTQKSSFSLLQTHGFRSFSCILHIKGFSNAVFGTVSMFKPHEWLRYCYGIKGKYREVWHLCFFCFDWNFNCESGLKIQNATVSIKTTGIIGLMLKVLGDRFAANYLFRADSIVLSIISFIRFYASERKY